jgi:1-acyl-sn-glycerol-3-phosphate acyltransferase
MWLIRSFLFQVWFYVSACIFSFMMAVLVWLPYHLRFVSAKIWSYVMLFGGRWLVGLRYQFEGLENIPDEACVILCKHSTVFEAYALIHLFPAQTWVLKRELMWIPFFGWGLAAAKPIAINRKLGRAAVTQVINQGKQRLADGIWVVVFPEGTRVPPGESRKFGVSGAALAREAGVQVVPVAHNAGDLWPRRGMRKIPGLITLVVGPPIDSSTQSPKETNRLAQSWIEGKMSELSPDAYSEAKDSQGR